MKTEHVAVEAYTAAIHTWYAEYPCVADRLSPGHAGDIPWYMLLQLTAEGGCDDPDILALVADIPDAPI